MEKMKNIKKDEITIEVESKDEMQQPPQQEQHKAPNISEMKATTQNAYGGGMYASEKANEAPSRPPASDTQSADGPAEAHFRPKHQPPSSGDRDTDITGQSYIQ